MDSQHSSPSENEDEDFLTVFQAAPLAYVDKHGETRPLKSLDFEFERDALTKAFQESGANIHLDFEIATTDSLSKFLADEKGRILHFSCHGHPQYFPLEDGWGGMQSLEFKELRQWIALGARNLEFVFVSSCFASLIAEAFIGAGVPHVVCCHHESGLREGTSGELHLLSNKKQCLRFVC